MIDKLTKQINNINQSLNWLRVNQEEQYEQRFLQLVEERRKLKIIRNAASDNPAIAAFGISQVGKSYLMNCLLKSKDSPYMVDDGNGKKYEFVSQINPIGEGKEASGVVTRFSSFSRNPGLYSDKYPVMARLFSVADIIMVLSDTYYNDHKDYGKFTLKWSDVEDISRSIREEFISAAPLPVPNLTADDVLNIKTYFSKHIGRAANYASSSCTFFDSIAVVIDRIPDSEYARVFSHLWNNDKNLTRLFNHLLSLLRDFQFAEQVYLPIDAVVHNNIKPNTIMSVLCLRMLFDQKYSYSSKVYIRKGNDYEDIGTHLKSEICALCKEAIFKIDGEFLTSTSRYDMEGIDVENVAKLSSGDVDMSILKDNDLLDFPGARSRLNDEVGTMAEDEKLLECMLRGKIAYLFNTYNDNLAINILLYCHHDKQNEVKTMPGLLKEWVYTYVGDTPEKRSATVAKADGSPLFYIATMFNIDMKERKSAADDINGLNNRWEGRFETVLLGECFGSTEEWVNNWTGPNKSFKNSYLLRDYQYSEDLYDGFRASGSEKSMKMDADYYKLMRKSFFSHPAVCKLFGDPALSWDVAATKNNDGTLYIIQNLKRVATNMNHTRNQQFNDQFASISSRIRSIMVNYYITDNKDDLLKKNIRMSKRVYRELDFTCNRDNYYFGHMLQGLQMRENVCYNLVYQDLAGNAINEDVSDFVNYEIIHKQCAKYGHPLDSQKSDNENWESLMIVYDYDTRDEAERDLARKKVDWKKLFNVNFSRKLRSFIIADKIFNAWQEHIKSSSFMNEFSGEDSFDNAIMTELVKNIIATAKKVKLADKMASIIADIVDVVAIGTTNINLISDMLVSTINDFVMDLGFSTLTEEQIASTKHIGEERNLHIFDYICRDTPARYSDEELTNLFNDMTTKPNILIPSFEENYNKWVEYMIISFIAHLEIPDYDHAANEALEVILKSIDNAQNEEKKE